MNIWITFFQQNNVFIYITNLPANKQFETSKNYCVHTFAGRPNLYYQSGQAGDNLPGDISASMHGMELKLKPVLH